MVKIRTQVICEGDRAACDDCQEQSVGGRVGDRTIELLLLEFGGNYAKYRPSVAPTG